MENTNEQENTLKNGECKTEENESSSQVMSNCNCLMIISARIELGYIS